MRAIGAGDMGVGLYGSEVASFECGESGERGEHAESGQPSDRGPVEAGSGYRADMGEQRCVEEQVVGRDVRSHDFDEERPQDQGVEDRSREPWDEPVQKGPQAEDKQGDAWFATRWAPQSMPPSRARVPMRRACFAITMQN
jgi:hypothetical protein